MDNLARRPSHSHHYDSGSVGPPPLDPAITQYAATAAASSIAAIGNLESSPPYTMDVAFPSSASAAAAANQPPQQDVDDFLRKKRKAREHKACYPCRQRKVKCDLSRPCQTCRDRDHPELCLYHPPNKRQTGSQDGGGSNAVSNSQSNGLVSHKGPEETFAPTPNGGQVTLGRGEFDMLCRKLNGLENSIAELRRELRRSGGPSSASPVQDFHVPPGDNSEVDRRMGERQRRPTHVDVHGFHTRNDAGDIVHVGGSSIPAMLYALGQGRSEGSPLQDMLGKTALPLFGLDNESATYPFVDLWGLPHGSLARAQGLAKALPNDEQLNKLVTAYMDMGYTIFPGIVDPGGLRDEAAVFLATRAGHALNDDGVSEREIYGKSYTWLAVLFAVLASGAQASVMSRKERELTSQVYICCSFECLRFTNVLSLANLESVQALVVIGHVMANNMNAGTAWSFHGLTVRIAQSLGLHQASPPIIPPEIVLQRSRVWWSIIWLDSLLSIGYDRPSSTYLDISTMPVPQHFGHLMPLHAAMYRLSKVVLDIVRERNMPLTTQEKYDRTLVHRDAIASLVQDGPDYLRDSRLCSNKRETLEHWALYLHTSYDLAELYRPAISPNSDPELCRSFRQSCIDHLINTLEAYLGLNNITSFAKNSWAALQRALSSALLLGIINEHKTNDRARHFISRFMHVLYDITTNLDPSELSGPVRRGLAALQRLRLAPDSGTGAPPSLDAGQPSPLDHPIVVTPTSSEGIGIVNDECSPHTLLNSILWGTDGYGMVNGQVRT